MPACTTAAVSISVMYRVLCQAVSDLTTLNPYLDSNIAAALMDAVAAVVLRANRIGHVNRCIAATIILARKLDNTLRLSPEQRAAEIHTLLPNLAQASQALAANIAAKRHYVRKQESDGKHMLDPRFAIFEFTWNILLRKKQVKNTALITAFERPLECGCLRWRSLTISCTHWPTGAPRPALHAWLCELAISTDSDCVGSKGEANDHGRRQNHRGRPPPRSHAGTFLLPSHCKCCALLCLAPLHMLRSGEVLR